MVPDYSLPQAVAFKNLLRDGARHSLKPTPLSLDDIAVLQYTGGTTGVAKGAMLTHGNLVANMQQVRANMQQLDAQGHPVIREGQEVMIAPLPLYHIYAFTVNCMCMMVTGNHNVLITNPRDINGFVKELQRWQFSAFLGLNTLFVALMAHPQFKKVDFSRLRAPIRAAPRWFRRWPSAGRADRLHRRRGLRPDRDIAGGLRQSSRRAFAAGYCRPAGARHHAESHRRRGQCPAAGRARRVVREGTAGDEGLLAAPEATAEVLDEEGWLRTGDIAVIDQDGFVSIVDRKKDLIIVSGFNVYPNEIEDVVMAHPKVAACAAIGVADEAVKLFVVPSDPTLTQEELHAYCRENFTGYKMPRHYVFRDALPMTPVGKILRRELRESA